MTERSNSSFLSWNCVLPNTPTVFWLQFSLQAHQLPNDQLWSKSTALFDTQCSLTTHFSCAHPNKLKKCIILYLLLETARLPGYGIARSEEEQVGWEGWRLVVVKEVSCGKIADLSWLLWAVEGDTLVVAEEKGKLQYLHVFSSEPCGLVFSPSFLGGGSSGRSFFCACSLSFRQSSRGFSNPYQLLWSWERPHSPLG